MATVDVGLTDSLKIVSQAQNIFLRTNSYLESFDFISNEVMRIFDADYVFIGEVGNNSPKIEYDIFSFAFSNRNLSLNQYSPVIGQFIQASFCIDKQYLCYTK